ncbi:MAG: response regulator [Magnetococcales bacterium]|nr:response regulator [Magnetococcales bacterium]
MGDSPSKTKRTPALLASGGWWSLTRHYLARVAGYKQNHPTAYRLLFYILVISSLFTLMGTALQIGFDYRKDVSLIKERMDQIQASHLHGIINSLWDMNDNQTRTLLKGILELPDVSYLEIIEEDGTPLFVMGLPVSGPSITSHIPLTHLRVNGVRTPLGELRVVATLAGVYQRLQERVLVILGAQAVKTFMVSAFILAIFHYLVTRHLNILAAYARRLNLDRLDEPLILKRSSGESAKPDELERVAQALNDMRVGLREDMALREEAESALRQSEAKYRRLIENMGAGFFLYSHGIDGIFTYVSPSITPTLGYGQEEFLSHFETYLTDNPINQGVVSHTHHSIRGRKQRPYEVEIYHKNGNVHLLEVAEVPVFDGRGEVIAVEGVARDVTASLQAERERQAREEAEEANRAKSNFLATMSHEIRTPMNGVLGMAKLLEQTELTVPQKEYVEIITKSGKALLDLLNDILDISRIEAGRLELRAVDFSPGKIITDLVELMSVPARGKGVDFTVSLEEGLPTHLRGDAGRLRQVLLNLLSNAVKFTDQGEIEIGVRRIHRDQGRVCLEFFVKDTGIGIPESELGRLFNAFTQVDGSVSRSHGGVGLGLAICERLVRAMGGDIQVSSRVGEGSLFCFSLYFQMVEPHKPMMAPMPEVKGKPLSILLVEDEPVSRMVAESLLLAEGHRVQTAENGQEALDQIEEHRFDIILLDIHMPGMDGMEVARQIRLLNDPLKATIPIIALTADLVRENVKRYLAEGIDFVESKPLDMERLNRVISGL